MSHIVPIEKINQFLPQEKLGLDTSVDSDSGLPVDHPKVADFEETARDVVHGQLRVLYEVDGWVDPASTPSMVVNILGMLVAGWVYDRQFSEEATNAGGYGQRRVREAYGLMNSILDGTIDLIGFEQIFDPTRGASVYESEPVFIMDEAF